MIDKNKYVELLNATVNDVNFEHINQLIKYIQENKPKSLFHYRRCSEQSIDAFRENNIFFNTASNFNDPYDCLVYCDRKAIAKDIESVGNEGNQAFLNNLVSHPDMINSAPSQISREFLIKLQESIKNGELANIVSGIHTEAYAEIKKDLQKAVDTNLEATTSYYQTKMPLVCLSERFNNILMWSHYADNHKGFVVEYDSNSLHTKCNQCVEGKNYRTCPNWQATMLLPILYTNKRYDATSYIVDSTIINIFNQKGFQGLWSFRDNFAQYKINIHKHNCWSYEKEWRLQLYNINGSKTIKVKPVAIYLGCRIAKCYEDILVKYANEQNIKIYKMSENPTKTGYRLTKKKY